MSTDDDGTLKPSVVRRLKESLATPKDKLLTSEQMGKKLGLTPVESLAALVMEKAREPCPNIHCHSGTVDVLDVRGTRLEDCPVCHGTGTILDTENPPPPRCWPGWTRRR